MRYLLIPVVALSMTAATAAFAASTQTTATPQHKTATRAHIENTKACATLTSQFDKAVNHAKATKSALKKARAERAQAQTSCDKGQMTKGVDQLRAALVKIGQKPQV